MVTRASARLALAASVRDDLGPRTQPRIGRDVRRAAFPREGFAVLQNGGISGHSAEGSPQAHLRTDRDFVSPIPAAMHVGELNAELFHVKQFSVQNFTNSAMAETDDRAEHPSG